MEAEGDAELLKEENSGAQATARLALRRQLRFVKILEKGGLGMAGSRFCGQSVSNLVPELSQDHGDGGPSPAGGRRHRILSYDCGTNNEKPVRGLAISVHSLLYRKPRRSATILCSGKLRACSARHLIVLEKKSATRSSVHWSFTSCSHATLL